MKRRDGKSGGQSYKSTKLKSHLLKNGKNITIGCMTIYIARFVAILI